MLAAKLLNPLNCLQQALTVVFQNWAGLLGGLLPLVRRKGERLLKGSAWWRGARCAPAIAAVAVTVPSRTLPPPTNPRHLKHPQTARRHRVDEPHHRRRLPRRLRMGRRAFSGRHRLCD